ncbi:MAG: hypothetical protein ACQESB_04315, partial [Elusimicrobiota bacterium]
MNFATNIYTKIINLSLALCMFFTYVISDYAYASRTLQNEIELDIPITLGQEVETHDPEGTGPRIVLIQDLHVNYEVQKNIQKIIEH